MLVAGGAGDEVAIALGGQPACVEAGTDRKYGRSVGIGDDREVDNGGDDNDDI